MISCEKSSANFQTEEAEAVILVDEDDNAVGLSPKLEAHKQGLLHRAFSIFLFNSAGEMLLHQRALSKYHSGGLWTNACCSHPRPGETVESAASRRLSEEMGLGTALTYRFQFLYRCELQNGLVEHEIDHVFTGVCDEEPKVDSEEIRDWKYLPVGSIREALTNRPEEFTSWFHIAFEKVCSSMEKR